MAKVLLVPVTGLVVVAGIVGYVALQEPAAPSRPIEVTAEEMERSGAGTASREPSPDATILQIQPAASTASFTVEEILRGRRTPSSERPIRSQARSRSIPMSRATRESERS